jgi:hypothetical protein
MTGFLLEKLIKHCNAIMAIESLSPQVLDVSET